MLLFLVILLQQILSKDVQQDVRIWQFHKSNCLFITRFGTPRLKGHIFFEHEIDWRSDDERVLFGDIRGDILILDEKGDLLIKELLNRMETDIAKKVDPTHLIGKFTVSLFENKVDHFEYELKHARELYYFYFCDHEQEIFSSYQRKLEKYRSDGKIRHQIKTSGENKSASSTEHLWNDKTMSLHSGSFLRLKLSVVDEKMFHHSLEAYHTGRITMCFLALYFFLFLFIFLKHRKYHSLNESVDHPLVSITSVIGCQFVSLSFKMGHFIIYGNVGYDYGFFDLFYKLTYMLSDGILCYFFLLMSKGWGIKTVHFIEDYELETALGIVIWLCRYLWIVVGYFTENQKDILFHMYDGTTGKLEIFNLIGLYVWFILSMRRSELSTREKYKAFGFQLKLLATAYFCARPICVLFIYSIEKVNQHELSLMVTLVSHLIVCSVLSLILTNKRGVYMNYSMSNGIELTGNTKIS